MSENLNPAELQKTCLYDRHVALQAKMSPFAGFMMPIQYDSITVEHNAVRQKVGVFDVSHMGEVFVEGPEAEKFVNWIFTNEIRGFEPGKVLYGMMCYPDGGVVDDLLVYREFAPEHFLLVVNAANIDKDFAWIEEHAKGFDCKVRNESPVWGQIAIQGPEAEKIVVGLLGLEEAADLSFYTFYDTEYKGKRMIVSRTGYTGEDGFELYTSVDGTVELWDRLIAAGVQPCGLGCRDTLRFEAGLPLYGDELAGPEGRRDRPQAGGYRDRGQGDSARRLSRGTGRRDGGRRRHDRLSFPLPGQEHLLRPRGQGLCRAGHPAVHPHPQEGLPGQGGEEAFLSDQLQEVTQ